MRFVSAMAIQHFVNLPCETLIAGFAYASIRSDGISLTTDKCSTNTTSFISRGAQQLRDTGRAQVQTGPRAGLRRLHLPGKRPLRLARGQPPHEHHLGVEPSHPREVPVEDQQARSGVSATRLPALDISPTFPKMGRGSSR